MSNLCKLSDALVMPFTLGMITGGALTGFVICFGLCEPVRLLGVTGISHNLNVLVGAWLFEVLMSVFVATLLELGMVRLISFFSASPLLPRLRSRNLFIVGALAACGCAIASCLTIDLGPHPGELWKGPSPPFSGFVIIVCLIAPLLLLKRAALPLSEPEADPATSRRDQSH
jgi:hypothetical protein